MASKPMPAASDVEGTWNYIEEGVEFIMTRLREGMSSHDYMQLYTVFYNFCTSSRMGSNAGVEPLGKAASGANLMGADLYRSLQSYFISHLASVRSAAEPLSDEPLLKYYTDEWKRYTLGAFCINRLFNYLNRYWIKRERDEGRRGIYPLYTLALVSWRDHFLKQVQQDNKLTMAILRLIERQRLGETVNTTLLDRVVESLVALGIDQADPSRTNVEVYKEAFEGPFISATETFYKAESESFLAENSVTDYMIKAESRLKEEEDRVDLYLHASTRKLLVLTCENVLVKAHSQALQEEFQRLLDNEKEDDLNRMYNLLHRIPDGLDPLRSRFEVHVKKAGLDAVERICGSEKGVDVEPKAYVDALLHVHGKNHDLVMTAFKGEPGFVASLDKAHREFVNRNKATGTSSSKSPELLAKYADGLLRKSNKAAAEESDLESALARTMTLFKYLEDKDIFQKFYSKMLAKRLIHFSSASDEAEGSMISKLKDACGFEYTTKLTRMFNDIGVCKDLNDQFKEEISKVSSEDKHLFVDAHMQILSFAAWPLQAMSDKPHIPVELLKTYERFLAFYNKKHNGRKLTWLWHLSRNEVRAMYTTPKITFQVSSYQAAVLLQFNHMGDSISYDDLKEATNLEDNTLKGVLSLLVKQKVLEEKDGNYDLNLAFRSKKVRVNLNQPIKSEVRAETAEVMKNVDEDRKLLIQAIIVRIMKSRKTLKHQQLIQEAIQQLSSRFNPKVGDIKKAIDTLIDREYLERVDGQRDTYAYLA